MKIARPVCLLILVSIVSGCLDQTTLSKITADTREKLLKTSIGMSKQEVIDIVGAEPQEVAGLQTPDGQNLAVLNNPYRSELIQSDDKTLEVDFFVTGDLDNNNVISNEELTPLVFDDGKMIGWGWSYLVSEDHNFKITVK
jgi:hypothetical protein